MVLRGQPSRRKRGPIFNLMERGHIMKSLVMLERRTLLANANSPELSLYEIEPGRWQLEGHGHVGSLSDGDTLTAGGRQFRLFSLGEPDDTQTDGKLSAMPWLIFRVSLDEEHTWLSVRCGPRQVDLGERSHHYALVTLARLRLADAGTGREPIAQGWVSGAKLARMLGLAATHLNIQIFRARDQLLNALPTVSALSQVVERRRGELRFGPLAMEIYRGSQLEGQWSPIGGLSA